MKSVMTINLSMRILFGTVAAGALLAPCLFADAEEGGEEIWASIPPVQWLVDELVGDRFQTHSLMTGSQDPHTFSATPRTLTRIRDAAMFVHCGTDFEQVLGEKLRQTFPRLTIVDMSSGLDGLELNRDDPHYWLSLKNLAAMAEVAGAALIQAAPDAEEAFAKKLTALRSRLTAANARFAERLAPYKGVAFYIHHPSFGHFAQDYGLVQKAVELQGKNPSPRQLLAVIQSARKDNVKMIVTGPQFADRPSRILAERIGGEVVSIDPLAANPIETLETLTQAIVTSSRHLVE